MVDLHPWLSADEINARLKLDPGNPNHAAKVALADLCRQAAADWIDHPTEGKRRDLWGTELVGEPPVETPVFLATDKVKEAGRLLTARLFARVDSPNGVVSFDQMVPGALLANDPDVRRLLGRSRIRLG